MEWPIDTYLAPGQERQRASAFSPLTPLLINAKIPAQFTGHGQERGKQQYAQPRFPLNTGTCFSANTQSAILLPKTNPAWFFTFQVICLLQLLEKVKSSETNLTRVFMKAVQQKMLFSCIQPYNFICDAALHLKANMHRSSFFMQQIFPGCICRFPVPGTAALGSSQPHCHTERGELLAKPDWSGNVVRGLPGALEQTRQQQLGLSLRADANKCAVELAEFLWRKMMNKRRGPACLLNSGLGLQVIALEKAPFTPELLTTKALV